MRILSVIETLGHGGAETVLIDLVSGLREHEHQVMHFGTTHGTLPHPWIRSALESLGVGCLDVSREAVRDRTAREAALGGFDPDVVVHHWWGQDVLRPWIADARADARADAPGDAPGDGPRNANGARQPVFLLVLHCSTHAVPPGYDAYVLVSPTQRPQVTAIASERVHVIPNGIELSRFSPALSGNRDGEPFRVGRVSNLRQGKIPADWIRTAAGYGLTGARFVIAGDGPMRAVLEADVRDLGLEATFSLPGYVARDEVPALLRTFDVFCYVTSTAVECHPLAVLEACAAGVPIVAESKGGIADIVRHGVNGFLASSPDEVPRFLHLLRDEPALRSAMAREAREIARALGVDVQVRRYGDLLRRAATV